MTTPIALTPTQDTPANLQVEGSPLPLTETLTLKELEVYAASFATVMLENQAALNTKSYNEAWIAKGRLLEFDYSLAASQEVAEFINSYGYSWWSHSPKDMSNCKTEIIDAVHFMLSQTIIECQDAPNPIEVATHIISASYVTSLLLDDTGDTLHFAKLLSASLSVNHLENIIVSGSEFYADPWVFLFALANSIDFDFGHLYARYMGKSVLNAFRQKNNYKKGVFAFGTDRDGKYLKKWDGVNEDNYFLADWIDSLTYTPSKEAIETWMQTTYSYYLNKSAEAMVENKND